MSIRDVAMDWIYALLDGRFLAGVSSLLEAVLKATPAMWFEFVLMQLVAVLAPLAVHWLARRWLLRSPQQVAYAAAVCFVLTFPLMSSVPFVAMLFVPLLIGAVSAGCIRAMQTGAYASEWVAAFYFSFFTSFLLFCATAYNFSPPSPSSNPNFPTLEFQSLDTIQKWAFFEFLFAHLALGLTFPWLLKQQRILTAIWRRYRPDSVFGAVSARDEEVPRQLPR